MKQRRICRNGTSGAGGTDAHTGGTGALMGDAGSELIAVRVRVGPAGGKASVSGLHVQGQLTTGQFHQQKKN